MRNEGRMFRGGLSENHPKKWFWWLGYFSREGT
jgi:hypothetical protein